MHTCSGPNAPNAFLASRFLPSPSPSGPAGDAGSWPLAAALPRTDRDAPRRSSQPAQTGRGRGGLATHLPPRSPPAHDPGPGALADPGSPPLPEAAPLGPGPRISRRCPRLAHPNTCSELQIFIAAAAGPGRGLGALRDAARRRGGGAPAVPPPPSRGPDCGG